MCRFCPDETFEIKADNVIGDANRDGSDADEWLLTLLLLLKRDTSAQLLEITLSALAAGSTPEYRALLEKLADAHAHGAYLGRRKAGVLDAFDSRDVDFGRLAAADQAPFLTRFLNDLKAGRYTNADGTPNTKQIAARWAQYEKRVVGSANEAWAFSLPGETKIYWITGIGDNCASCPALAANSPYTPATLPTVPRAGGTDCNVNCNCYLSTESGATSFRI